MRVQFNVEGPEDLYWYDILKTLDRTSDTVKKELYDTEIIRLVDFIWVKYYYWLLAYNAIYVFYPIIIIILLAFTEKSLHDNSRIAIYFTIIPAIFEIIQI